MVVGQMRMEGKGEEEELLPSHVGVWRSLFCFVVLNLTHTHGANLIVER